MVGKKKFRLETFLKSLAIGRCGKMLLSGPAWNIALKSFGLYLWYLYGPLMIF